MKRTARQPRKPRPRQPKFTFRYQKTTTRNYAEKRPFRAHCARGLLKTAGRPLTRNALSGRATPHYIRRPFHREPDFGVTSVNYDLDELLSRGEEPA